VRGIDTNVLVRFLLRDDIRQAIAARRAIAKALSEGEPLVVSLVTLLETEWVLRANGGFDKARVVRELRRLFERRDIVFEDDAVVEQSLEAYADSNADFAECLMIAQYQRLGCSSMLTFDARAAKLPGGELLA
jgi:predicted nucleic-acid-binding protein